MTSSTLQDRIKLALEKSGLSKTDLWKGCRVRSSTVTSWFKGPNQTISGINLMNASKILGVNPDWLATGNGEMKAEIYSLNNGAVEPSIEIFNKNPNEPIKSIKFDLNWLKSKLPNQQLKNLNVLTFNDDSMRPTFEKGGLVIVDISINSFKNDGIYLIESNAGIFIRRIHKNIDGNMLIKPDNTSYNPEALYEKETSELRIIGKVILSWPEKII